MLCFALRLAVWLLRLVGWFVMCAFVCWCVRAFVRVSDVRACVRVLCGVSVLVVVCGCVCYLVLCEVCCVVLLWRAPSRVGCEPGPLVCASVGLLVCVVCLLCVFCARARRVLFDCVLIVRVLCLV